MGNVGIKGLKIKSMLELFSEIIRDLKLCFFLFVCIILTLSLYIKQRSCGMIAMRLFFSREQMTQKLRTIRHRTALPHIQL